MEKSKSKILVVDKQSRQTLFECGIDDADKAYHYAGEMEEMGLDVEVLNPTLAQTLSNSLGLSAAQVQEYEASMEEEMEEHEGSCCFEDPSDKKIDRKSVV